MGKKRNKKMAAIKSAEYSNGIITNDAEVMDLRRVLDAYQNLPANLGAGAGNLAQASHYVMERFTWDYWTLNVLFRNNWIAKAIIEKPANEMLKNGFELQTQIEPEKVSKVMQVWTRTKTKDKFLDCLKWARLYGGCLLIPMIANQGDLAEPLNYDEIDVDSYNGCFTVDRWSGVSPSVELVDDISSPEFGQPKYYTISDNTTGKAYRIHHSRVIKLVGRELPYWETLSENYWGASELEHVYTELKKRDDTSANISFLIFLANIRVFKMEGLSQMITMGDQKGTQNVFNAMRTMNQLMCNTGTLVVDKDEDFSEQQYSFTGINDVYESFMLDISGAAEIPVDKLFGRSPAGFNGGAETLQNYYDMIQEKQETDIRSPLEKLMKIIIMSTLGEIPDDLDLKFNPVRRPADMEKADLAQKMFQPVADAVAGNLIDKATGLRELKQQSSVVGMWTNITDEMIDKAKKEADEEKKQREEEENELMTAALSGGKSDEKETENTIDPGNKKYGSGNNLVR